MLTCVPGGKGGVPGGRVGRRYGRKDRSPELLEDRECAEPTGSLGGGGGLSFDDFEGVGFRGCGAFSGMGDGSNEGYDSDARFAGWLL